MLFARIATNFLGLIIFLFIFWKKTKEDFSSEIVFKSASLVLLGSSMFYLISFNFFPDWFLWFAFFGGILGLTLAIFSQKVRFYEIFEAFVISMLPWVSLVFLYDSIVVSSFNSFCAFLISLTLIFLSYWLDNNYKRFFWYKSGKIGISGLILLAIVFLIRSIVAFFGIHVISFTGSKELVFSGVAFLISLLLIYFLAKHDK